MIRCNGSPTQNTKFKLCNFQGPLIKEHLFSLILLHKRNYAILYENRMNLRKVRNTTTLNKVSKRKKQAERNKLTEKAVGWRA